LGKAKGQLLIIYSNYYIISNFRKATNDKINLLTTVHIIGIINAMKSGIECEKDCKLFITFDHHRILAKRDIEDAINSPTQSDVLLSRAIIHLKKTNKVRKQMHLKCNPCPYASGLVDACLKDGF
jgi:hypothetical protein